MLWKEIWISASTIVSVVFTVYELCNILSPSRQKNQQEQKRKYKYNHFKYFLVLHKINWIRLDLKFLNGILEYSPTHSLLCSVNTNLISGSLGFDVMDFDLHVKRAAVLMTLLNTQDMLST